MVSLVVNVCMKCFILSGVLGPGRLEIDCNNFFVSSCGDKHCCFFLWLKFVKETAAYNVHIELIFIASK